MHLVLYYLLICLFISIPQKTTACSFPNALKEEPILANSYKLVGEASFKWLFLDVYDIKLSTPTGQYTTGSPLVLELTYFRKISREQLVTTTEKEWKRQSILYQDRWLTTLLSIWPDVKPYDSLSLHIAKNGTSYFFYNGEPIGQIKEKTFASAFSDIWLSTDTLKPKLRKQLIGDPKK